MERWTERPVDVGTGATLWTRTRGPDDGPVLLVVHGGPDWDGSYLADPLHRLPGVRVVLPDLRGCGRSTTGPGGCTPDAVVADLLGLLDALGVEQADLLGFSWGGLVAQRLADAAPPRFRRLVLASTSVLPVDEAAFGDWPLRAERRAGAAAVWADPSLTGPEFARRAALAGARADVWRDDVLPGYLARLDRVRFSGAWLATMRTGLLTSPRIPDPVARLTATGLPALLLHGGQDMVFPAALVAPTLAQLPGARAVVLAGAGHMAHVDDPDGWLAAVRDFLA